MKAATISTILASIFDSKDIKQDAEEAWQVSNSQIHLMVIISEDHSRLRLLAPIASAKETQSLWSQLLEDNFYTTQEVRYALNKGVLWGVFNHSLVSLTEADLKSAIASILAVVEKGLTPFFDQLIEKQITQIVKDAKAQGQSLESTYQTINRFYQEGIMGDIDQDPIHRKQFLAAWKAQLNRLWSEIEV